MNSIVKFVSICLIIDSVKCFGPKLIKFKPNVCQNDSYFQNVLKPEIESKSEIVNEIIHLVLNSSETNVTYNELATFVDTFGNRLTGSEALEKSIDYLVAKLQSENLTDVYTEKVFVPQWERGEEYAEMLEPRHQKLSILGLGGSVNTSNDGITAELIVFNSLEEFNESSQLVSDKIVLYNNNIVNGSYVRFKLDFTRRVAEAGGLAVLFKSFSTYSAYLPHAGIIRYSSEDLKIPAASLTIEESDMFRRMTGRGDTVVIKLTLNGKFNGFVESRNLIAEIKGSEHPDEVVIVSGHLDSWDVGQGALDDGGGAFISWRALALVNKLGLKPKRTLRTVLFTGQEQGFYGSKAYVEKHENQLNDISILLESDFGTFLPYGLTFSGNNITSQCIVYETLQLLKSIKATKLLIGNGIDLTQTDANEFSKRGVPASGLLNKNQQYFHYQHTNADYLNVLDPNFMDLCTIVWTAASYVLSDLSIKIPRSE